MPQLLLGNEALARGAIDAGLSAAYAYPGTPSTEITEYLVKSPEAARGDIVCRWTANEKTALEAAIGASYAGVRAMASMKHVGLNVAADPFVNAAIAGANGGLVITAADDPSMHSSQNEQDSRLFTDIALMPCIEPADQQEAYQAPAVAFELSEKHRIPVLLRMTTRLCHSRATIELGERRDRNALSLPEDPRRYILLPVIARGSYEHLIEQQPALIAASESSPFTEYIEGADTSLGIIACGLAYSHLIEVLDPSNEHPILKIGQYPLPEHLVEQLVNTCERILVIEEGYPYVEGKLRGFPLRSKPVVHGRLSGHLPRTGELNPQLVADAIGASHPTAGTASTLPAPRPPALCPGCPHIDTSKLLKQVLSDYPETGKVFSDIGCYTLGALPPYRVIDTCVEMGASITMAKGASRAGLHPAVALIGDSTFTHSGMTGLLDCVNENANVTVVIVDNLTTAMTGGQPSAADTRLVSICKGLGIDPDHLHVIEPLPKNHQENMATLKAEIDHDGPSVIISQRECIQTARRRKKAKPADGGAA